MKRNWKMVLVLSVLICFGTAGISTAGTVGISSDDLDWHAITLIKKVIDDDNNWVPVDDGAIGFFSYKGEGNNTFYFSFYAKGLERNTEYSLIYYPDPWPGEGLIVLGKATSSWFGTLTIGTPKNKAEAEIGSCLPDCAIDANCVIDKHWEVGAKVWLVPSEDVTEATLDEPGHMSGWNPDEILFETGYVFYKNTSLENGCTTFQCSKCDNGEEEAGLEIIPE